MRHVLVALFLTGIATASRAQDPSLCGAWGSNNAGTVAGHVDEPWSYWMNTAHAGVAAYFGLSPVPHTTQTFAETGPDKYHLTYSDYYGAGGLRATGVAECWDSGWSPKSWDVPSPHAPSGSFQYRRRSVALPSGAALFVFRPFHPGIIDHSGNPVPIGPFVPEGLDTQSGYLNHYKADALFRIENYQGGPFGVNRNPEMWLSQDSYPYAPAASPYSAEEADSLFGWEIETLANPFPSASPIQGELLSRTKWVRYGSPEREALERGMTFVVVLPGIGLRPVVASMSHLLEASAWLDGPGYESSNLSKEHRRFLTGGSVGGAMTNLALRYMPWLFRGGISLAGFNDFHSAWDWITTSMALQDQMTGHYKVANEMTGAEFGQFIDLERGYAHGGVGITGASFDSGGMSHYARQLAEYAGVPLAAPSLLVPVVDVVPDEDPSQFYFLDVELDSLQCGSSGSYSGKILHARVPRAGHGDTGAWYSWNEDFLVLQRLMDEVNANQPVPPFVPGAGHEDDSFVAEVPPGGPQWGDELRTTLLAASDAAAWSDTANGVTAADVDTSALRVHGGLGSSGRIWVRLAGTEDPDLEVVAGDAHGNVVRLRVVEGATELELQTLGSVRVSSLFGPTEVVPINATDALAVHVWGDVARVRVGGTTPIELVASLADDTSNPWLAAAHPFGWFLRDVKKLPGVPNTFSAFNDRGERIVLRTPSSSLSELWSNRSFVEGRPGSHVPEAGGRTVYLSAHGNVKRTMPNPDPMGLGQVHTNDEDDVSPHLYSFFQQLLAVDAGDVRFVASTNDFVVLLDQDLRIVDPNYGPSEARPPATPEEAALADARFTGLGFPDGLQVACAGSEEISLIGYNFRPDGPYDADAYAPAEIRLLRIAFGPSDPQEIAVSSRVTVPGPVAALAPCPAGFEADFGGVQREVAWVATLQSGQVALVADLCAASGDVTATHAVVVGKPLGNCFGFVRVPGQSGSTPSLRAVGPQGKSWTINPYALPGSGALVGSGASHGIATPEGVYPPFRGALLVDDEMYGLADGGAAYPPITTLDEEQNPVTWTPVATPFSFMPSNLSIAFAGFRVIDLDDFNDSLPGSWEWSYPPPSSPAASTLMSVLGVGWAEFTSFSLRDIGNSCAWADLDGDGVRDLVAGTHGGRVLWWENAATDESSLSLGSQIAGEYQPPFAHESHGFENDLGSQVIGMAAGDLDDDGDADVVVGIGLAANPELPEHLLKAGRMLLLTRGTDGALEPLDEVELPNGVYGLKHFEVNTTVGGETVNDDYLVAGTAGGRLFVFHYDHAGTGLAKVYESACLAPMIGAYNSIETFVLGGGGATQAKRRIVAASSDGFFAVDLTLPRPFPQ